MLSRVQHFVQRFLASAEFKVLVTDGATQPLVEQLFGADRLQRCNVCLVLDIEKAAQRLPPVVQQGLSRVVFVLSGASLQRCVELLNRCYT